MISGQQMVSSWAADALPLICTVEFWMCNFQVRYIGVSNETSFGVMEFVHLANTFGLPKIISIQNSYSLLVRCAFEVNLVEVCDRRNCNVGLLAYSPLAGGVLSGKYLDMDSEKAKRGRLGLFPGYMSRYLKSQASEAVKKYADVGHRHGLTPTQLALAFVRDQPFVTSSIIGATTMEQLKENLSVYTLPRPLSAEILSEISDIFSKHRDPALI
ncbi:hypothetical protein L7F22_033756 [Adiantum nelumboides]|nr:hypothetical protein [Adiantum nelumboides]